MWWKVSALILTEWRPVVGGELYPKFAPRYCFHVVAGARVWSIDPVATQQGRVASWDTRRCDGALHSAESVGQLRQLWHSRFTTLWPCDRSITVSPLYNGRKCDTGQLQTPPDHWPTPTRAQPFTIEIDRYYLVDHIGVSIARNSG